MLYFSACVRTISLFSSTNKCDLDCVTRVVSTIEAMSDTCDIMPCVMLHKPCSSVHPRNFRGFHEQQT
uniref:Uncharacterized protein n=1 Tax=Phytophthora fragariae TaxID=53985 RepID=A0A6A3FHS2_9STRA|nr:hypothetical protein PF009_g6374 [Phytophthora fragariae]